MLGLELRKVAPSATIVIAMVLAFLLFAALDFLETSVLGETVSSPVRFLHLARGFCATAGGMFVVWWIMTRKETELVRLRDHFAEELDKRTCELSQAGEALEAERDRLRHVIQAMKQQREDFISALKHKLRTPIMADRRAAELLLDGAFGAVNDEQSRILQLVQENENKLAILIDNLVEIYRYQNGIKQLCFRSHPVPAIVGEVAEKFAAAARERGVKLTTRSPECLAQCDRTEIVGLLGQLVENAVQHATSLVWIRAEMNHGGENLRFVVGDDGPGLSDGDIGLLFDRFFDLSAEGKRPPTTGTGLCLCQQIVEAHGGTIECKSEPGRKTEFIVTLPSGSPDDRQEVVAQADRN